MWRDALRRRRVPAGLVLLLLAAWLAAGIRHIDEDGDAAVLDSRLGLIAPRLAEPGWHLVPPVLLRLSLYPVRSRTLTLESGSGQEALVTREGSAVEVDLTLRYRVAPEQVLEVHKALGPRFEDSFLRTWTQAALSDALSGARYADVSGTHVDALQAQVSRDLTDRFREAGLALLACDVGGIRLRTEAGSAVTIRAVAPGRVLMVGLDGADWNIVDPLLKSGRMPHLDRLIRSGVRARMRTIAPMLSPVVWTSMATGVVPARHGILDFVATTDREGERVPVSSTQRRVKALWNILSDSGIKVGIVGWWATWPAEQVNGFIVTDRVAQQIFGASAARGGERAGKVYPAEADDLVVSQTLAPEMVSPADLEPFMRLPGDATELPQSQAKLIDDFKTLFASGETYVRSAVALTARYRPDFVAVYLEGTDTVGHLFMPYAPPPLSGVEATAQQRFSRVVDEYYCHVDGLLGRLIEAVNPSTVIVASDHGFRTGDNRPLTESRIGYGAAADWHRKYGILVLSGPPFRAGTVVDEASVLDLTPTLLRLFGLPVGEDMDGRPTAEAFDPGWAAAHPEHYIPTWEKPGEVARDEAQPRAGAASPDQSGDQERLQKLRDLGYIGGSDTGTGKTPAGAGGGRNAPAAVTVETANTHNNRGTILFGEGRWDDAIHEFEQAMAAKEDLAIARLNLARAYYRKKDYARSEAILRDLLGIQPRSKEAENILGSIAMDQGHFSEAETHFKKALLYEPNFTDARNGLGLLYEKLGRHDEALAEFRRVVAVDSDYAEGFNNIGIILKREGRIEEAVAAFQRAIVADPAFAGAYSNLGLILEDRKDYRAAEEHFRSAVRRDPQSAAALDNLGGLLIHMGRFEEARQALEKAITLDPDFPSAYNNLGAILGHEGKTVEEIASYRKAVSLDPNSADFHHNLGLALLKSGSGGEGEEEMRRALVIDRRYAPVYINLGRYLLDRNRGEDSIRLLQDGVGNLPGDAEVRLLLGEALIVGGHHAEGSAILDEAMRMNPHDEDFKKRVDLLRNRTTGETGKANE